MLFKIMGLSLVYKHKSLGDITTVYTLLPLVIGQCLHFFTSAIFLVLGVEQVKKSAQVSVFKSIEERVKGFNVYTKNKEDIKRIFYFAQMYFNASIGFLFLLCLNYTYGKTFVWELLTLFGFALIASIFNILYGRAILIESKIELN